MPDLAVVPRMTRCLSLLAASAVLVAAGCTDMSAGDGGAGGLVGTPPQTVPSVDLKKLSGLWYENASIPSGGAARTAAVLSMELTTKNTLALSYRWHEKAIDGPSREVTAIATPIDPPNDVKFRLKPSPSPLPGQLWVLAIASDYSVVALGAPDRSQVFILSRQPTIFANTFGELVHALQDQGYPTDRLQLTMQTPSAR